MAAPTHHTTSSFFSSKAPTAARDTPKSSGLRLLCRWTPHGWLWVSPPSRLSPLPTSSVAAFSRPCLLLQCECALSCSLFLCYYVCIFVRVICDWVCINYYVMLHLWICISVHGGVHVCCICLCKSVYVCVNVCIIMSVWVLCMPGCMYDYVYVCIYSYIYV